MVLNIKRSLNSCVRYTNSFRQLEHAIPITYPSNKSSGFTYTKVITGLHAFYLDLTIVVRFDGEFCYRKENEDSYNPFL